MPVLLTGGTPVLRTMHEMSIAEGIIQTVLSAAGDSGARRVSRVELAVGQMRLVVPEAMEMAWRAVSEGTIADGSELAMTEVPIEARCRQCGRAFTPQIDDYLCPGCGQADVDIIAGDDIILTSIACEVEEERRRS